MLIYLWGKPMGFHKPLIRLAMGGSKLGGGGGVG